MQSILLITVCFSTLNAIRLNRINSVPTELQKESLDLSFGGFELTKAEYHEMHNQFQPKKNNAHMSKFKKPAMFIHVHKSLGTWMCNAMKLEGVKTPHDPDCSVLADQPWHFHDFDYFEKNNTCANRKKMVDENGWTFHEIERQIHFEGGDICPESMYSAIIFRNPIDRMQSQMQANLQTWGSVSEWLLNINDLAHAHSWMKSHVGYDNFYIRTFLGRGFFLGSGKITREHLERAKQYLLKVDAVLDASDLLTQLTQVEAITGIDLQTKAEMKVHNNGCQDPNTVLKDGNKCEAFQMPEEARKELLKLNALDMEFYQFAKDLAKKKTEDLSA